MSNNELEKTFDLPEGNYPATLSAINPRIKATVKGTVETVRLLFAVTVPTITSKQPMAGRTFTVDLKSGSDLRCFLQQWVGADWFNNKTINNINLNQLIGRNAELTLKHHHNVEFSKPLVLIYNAVKPGTLKLVEFIEAAAHI